MALCCNVIHHPWMALPSCKAECEAVFTGVYEARPKESELSNLNLHFCCSAV